MGWENLGKSLGEKCATTDSVDNGEKKGGWLLTFAGELDKLCHGSFPIGESNRGFANRVLVKHRFSQGP